MLFPFYLLNLATWIAIIFIPFYLLGLCFSSMEQARMVGGLSFLTILGVEVVAAVAVLVVLIWNVTSVVNLVILPVNVAYVVDQEDAVAAAHPDFAGALAMGEG